MANLSWSEKDGVLTARLEIGGQLTQQQTEDLGRELLELVGQCDAKMVLDFQDVEYISSAFIGRLVMLQKKCEEGQIDLEICSVPTLVMNVLKIARLDKVFKIEGTTGEV
jgi:anti-sigma B factor antagonist